MNSRGETGNKLRIKPTPSEKLLNTILTDYESFPQSQSKEADYEICKQTDMDE